MSKDKEQKYSRQSSHHSTIEDLSPIEKKQSDISSLSLLSTISKRERKDDDTSKKDKYKKACKILQKDKEKLKEKLKLLITDFEERNDEYEKDIENYEEQINSLILERDELKEEYAELRDNKFDDQSKLREHYEEKLLKQKETMEKRYAVNGKEIQTIKKLEGVILSLNEKIAKQIEEKEKLKESLTQTFTYSEELLKKRINELEEQLSNSIDACNKNRNEFQQLIQTFNYEKEHLVSQIKKEKDDEYKQIINEKQTIISTLQNIKVEMEKRGKISDKERDEQIAQANFNVEKYKLESEKKLSDVTLSFTRKLDEVRHEYEGKMFEQERTHRIGMEGKIKEYERKIENILSESSKKIELLMGNFQQQIIELKKAGEKLMEENEYLRTQTDQEIAKREKAIEKKYNIIIEKMQLENNSTCEIKDKEIMTLRTRDEKIIAEMSDNNNKLKEQIFGMNSNMRKIQENSQSLSTQFLNNLNEQKELFSKETTEKEQLIADLRKQLQHIGNDSTEKVISLERRLKNSLEELKETQDRLTNAKSNVTKSEQFISTLKDQIGTLKDSHDKINEKAKLLQLEKEMIEKKYTMVDTESKNKDQDLGRMKGELTRLLKFESITKDETSKLSKEIDSLSSELEKRKKELELANSHVISTRDEYNKIRIELEKSYQLRYSNMQAEKEKGLNEISSRLMNLQNLNKSLEEQKETSRNNINILTTERDKLRNECERLSQDLERTNKSIHDLQKEFVNVKSNFITVSKDNTNKDQEINDLKQKAKTLETKEAQIVQMTNQFNSTQLNYKLTIDNLTSQQIKDREELHELRKKVAELTDQVSETQTLRNVNNTLKENIKVAVNRTEEQYKKDVTKLNTTIKDYETKIILAEQKTEQVKLEMLKKLNEATSLVPEDQKKLDETLKENTDLKIKLSFIEKNFSQLQSDFANASATIRTKTEALTQKEEELRKEAERLRTMPPKLLDAAFKQARDDALAQLRQNKQEIAKIKQEMLTVTQKLHVAETLVENLKREKNTILEAQNDLKSTYVQNMNQQQVSNEQMLNKKDERIQTLENMLNNKIKS